MHRNIDSGYTRKILVRAKLPNQIPVICDRSLAYRGVLLEESDTQVSQDGIIEGAAEAQDL